MNDLLVTLAPDWAVEGVDTVYEILQSIKENPDREQIIVFMLIMKGLSSYHISKTIAGDTWAKFNECENFVSLLHQHVDQDISKVTGSNEVDREVHLD